MKKLSLDLDDLQVESFTTHGAAAERGTVQAYCCYCCCCCCCCTCCQSCGGTCDAAYTCAQYHSCNGGFSCNGTCHNDYTCAGGWGESCNGEISCGGSCEWTCNYTECDCPPSYYAMAADDRIPAC